MQTSGTPGSLDLTGGEYKTWERIHRGIADPRLLAIPTSWGRVAALNPNWGRVWRIGSALLRRDPLSLPLYHVCSPRHQGSCWPGVILSFLPPFWLLSNINTQKGGSLAWHIKHTTRVSFVTPLKGTIQTTNWRRPCNTCFATISLIYF